jgi:hypothetical protein
MTTTMQTRLAAEIATTIAAARAHGYAGTDADYELTAEDCEAISEELGADRPIRSLSALRAGAAVDCLCRECCAGRPDGCETIARG